MQTATANAGKFNAVNTERFFKEISHFFENIDGVLTEIAQNAHRAGATTLNIKIDKENNTLTAEDNGHGADSVAPMFCLADSAWSKEVEEGQMPAGWGLFYLMAISERVAYQSAFGYVEVDCNRFLGGHEYREGLFGLIKPNEKATGFRLVANLKEGVAARLTDLCEQWKSPWNYPSNLSYFPLDIVINGMRVERHSLSEKIEGGYTTLEYKPGCTIYLKPLSRGRLFRDGKAIYDHIGVVFHGIPINVCRNFYAYSEVFIDVTEGCPLTPVLPYRTAIKKDEKLAELCEYIRQYIVDTIVQEMESRQRKDKDITNMLLLAEDVMKQAELDALDTWYVTRNDHNDRMENDTQFVVVRKGETPVSQLADLRVNGAEAENDFVIEDGLVKSVSMPVRRPDWVTVESERIVVDVRYTPAQVSGCEFEWQKADSITVGGQAVKVLCTMNSDYDIDTIYYTESPRDFRDIDDTVFRQYLRRDDEDYEVQEDDFRERVSSDIQRLTGLFERSDILKGLWTANIAPYNIQSLSMETNTIKVTFKDGTERVLSLAA